MDIICNSIIFIVILARLVPITFFCYLSFTKSWKSKLVDTTTKPKTKAILFFWILGVFHFKSILKQYHSGVCQKYNCQKCNVTCCQSVIELIHEIQCRVFLMQGSEAFGPRSAQPQHHLLSWFFVSALAPECLLKLLCQLCLIHEDQYYFIYNLKNLTFF